MPTHDRTTELPTELDLSRLAMTVRLTVHTPSLPEELDQPETLGLIVSSKQVMELNDLWKMLRHNTLSLQQTFVCYTTPHPGYKADRYCRLLPLAQYERCCAQLRRHREDRIRITLRLQKLLAQAVETSPAAAGWSEALHRETAVHWQADPAPTAAEFLNAELKSLGPLVRIPGWCRAGRHKALLRYRQALAEVRERQQCPQDLKLAWRQFSRLSWPDYLKFRIYFLLPWLPGSGRPRQLARQLWANLTRPE